MDVIPAVDLMDGKVVRLSKGKPELVTSYEHLGDPVSVAKRWEAEGARFIHVVDLDAALGTGSNLNVIEAITRSVEVPLQVGGGVRTFELACKLLNLGVSRCILASVAFSEPLVVKMLLEKFGRTRVVVALDNLNGMVLIKGWKDSAEITVNEAAVKFSEMGVSLFLVTSVARDGTLTGPDIHVLDQICRKGINVIAAGGISSLDDLIVLKKIGVNGVVVGKALYEGRFSLGEALKIVRDS